MKKLFLLPVILLSITAFSQVHMELGYGASLPVGQLKEQPKKVLPVLKFAIGYEFDNIVVEASEEFVMTRVKNAPNLLGLKAGYNFNGLIPSVGMFYNYANADDRSNNGWHPGFSLKYQVQINDNGGLFAEGFYAHNTAMITAGIHYRF